MASSGTGGKACRPGQPTGNCLTLMSEHPMKKLCILIAACAVLAACDKKDTPAPQAAAPAATAQPETKPQAAADAKPAEQPAAAPQTNASLPSECEDYVARVKACVSKAGGDAASKQFEQALEQSKAQWDAVADKSQLIPACKSANEQFSQMASMMKCE